MSNVAGPKGVTQDIQGNCLGAVGGFSGGGWSRIAQGEAVPGRRGEFGDEPDQAGDEKR